jgi:hypothetical protein
MPPPPIQKTAPKVILITVIGHNSASRTVANTIHLQYSGSGLLAVHGTEIATDVLTAWQDEVLDILNNKYTLEGANWLDLDNISGLSGTIGPVGGHPTNGATSNPSGSPQVSLLVHKRITGSGRGARGGRMYLGPFDEAEVTDTGGISPATYGTWQGKIDAFFNAIEGLAYGVGQTATPCVPHWLGRDKPADTVGGEWPADGVSECTNFQLDERAATQRRRLR